MLRQPVGARAGLAARGRVTLACPCPPPPWEPGGTGRSRVVREDLPAPHQHAGEGRESRRAERCTWGCAKCLGSPSPKIPPQGQELVASVQEGTCSRLAGCQIGYKAGEATVARLTQRWGPGAAPKSAAPHQKAAAPDPDGYCFVPCNGYLGCSGMSPKPTGQHDFFFFPNCLPAPKTPWKTHPAPPTPPSHWDAIRLGQQEHPCSSPAGVPSCPHAVPSTILTCSGDGSTRDGAMGIGTGTREGTLTPTPSFGTHRNTRMMP